MARRYNQIYNLLVSGGDDIFGHIAYSIYKADKIEFINHFREEHNGDEPAEEDLEQFHQIASLPSNIERLKLQSSKVINLTIGDHLAKMRNEIERDVQARSAQILASIVEPLRPKSFWKSLGENVFISVISSIVLMLMFSLLVAWLSFQDSGISFRIGKDGSATIEQTK